MTEKASKVTANYRDGEGAKRCDHCTMFRAPSSCTAVAGSIDPGKLCDYFKHSIAKAAAAADTSPTDAQKKAGNYKKGHITLHGLDITIENAKGSTRSGKDGKKWTVTMPAHYGYIKRTTGADDDNIDVYIGPAHGSRRVFLVDQVDAAGRHFDEHKAMLGFLSKEHAVATYKRAFSDGKGARRIGAVSAMGINKFKDWIATGDHKHPHAQLIQHFAEGGAVAPVGDAGEDDWQPVGAPQGVTQTQSPQGEDDGWQPVSAPPWQQPQGGDDDWQPISAPPFQQTSAMGVAARSFARGVVPTIASIPAAGLGAVLGGAAGTLVEPGGGTLVGGIGGALAAGGGAAWLTTEAENWVADKLGIDSPEQREADVTQHPRAAFLGGLAPAVLAFSPGKIAQQVAPEGANLLTRAAMTPAGQRAVNAAAMGGMETGQEAANGDLDYEHIAEAAGAGALFAKPTRFGSKLLNTGEGLGARIAGRPDLINPDVKAKQEADNSVPPNVSRGVAEEKPPPDEDTTTVGNPQSAPERSSRRYPTDKEPTAPLSNQPSSTMTFGLDPAQQAALDSTLGIGHEPPAPDTAAQPGAPPNEPAPQAPAQPQPAGRQLKPPPPPPIDTGIVAAAADQFRDNTDGLRAGHQGERPATPAEPAAPAEPVAGETQHPSMPVTVDRTKEVPYLAGSSNDNTRVYIDPQVPDEINVNGKTIDPADSLAVHEVMEHRAMTSLEQQHPDWSRDHVYDVAHERVGTVAEENYLRKHLDFDDADIARYQEIMHELAAKTEKERPGQITPPADLYTKPYPAREAETLQRQGDVTSTVTPEPAAAGAEPTAPAAPVEQPSDSARQSRVLPDLRTQPIDTGVDLARTPAPRRRDVVPGLGVQASTEIAARDKQRYVDAAQHALDANPPPATVPVSKADRQAFVERLRRAIADATEANFGEDPLAYKPRSQTAAQLWLRDAKRLVDSKTLPSVKRMQKFLSDEQLLRNGGAQDVRDTNKIEGGIAKSRRSGDDAIDAAQNEQAREFPTDYPGEDIPDSEIHPETQARGAEGLDKLLSADFDLEHVTPEQLDQMAAHLNKVSDNIANPKRTPQKAGETPKGSEGAASEVRRPQVSDEEKAALVKKYEALSAKDSVKRAIEAHAPKSLKEALGAFASDEDGSLNLPRLRATLKMEKPRLLREADEHFGVARNDSAMLMEQAAGKMKATTAINKNSIDHVLAGMWEQFTKGATPHDTDVFLHGVETYGDDPARFKQLLGDLGVHPDKVDWMEDFRPLFKKLMNNANEMDVKAGVKYDARENYVQHIYEDPAKYHQWLEQHIKSVGKTAYAKERTFDTLMQASAAGLKRKFTNPADILSHRMGMSFHNYNIMEMAHDLISKGVAHIVDGNQPKAVADWPRANLPGEINGNKQLAIDPTAYHIWDNAIQKADLWSREDALGDAFRSWMAAKALWVPIKLSISGFHPVHIAFVNLAQNYARELKTAVEAQGSVKDKLMRGASGLATATKQSVLDPLLATKFAERLPYIGGMAANFEGKLGRQMLRKPLSEMSPYERRVYELYRRTGSIPELAEQDKARLQRALMKAWSEQKYAKALPLAAGRVIEKLLQGPIFGEWIPNLKTAQTLRSIGAMLERNPSLMSNDRELGVNLKEVGKNMDDRFGEMFYDSLNWSPYLKNIGQGAMLSLGWQFFARQAYGAAANPIKSLAGHGGPLAQSVRDNTDRGSYILSYVATSMGLAGLVSWAMTGKAPTELKDYFFPQSGFNNPDGSPHRMTTMSNVREAPQLYYHTQESNSILSGLGQMIWNKTILQPLVDVWHNKDYFGNELSDPNAPWYQRFAQIIDSELGNQLGPISFSGAKRSLDQGGSARDVVMSGIGFGPAPAYASRDAFGNRVAYAFDKYSSHTTPYDRGGSGLISGVTSAVTGLLHGRLSEPQNQVEARRQAQGDLFKAQAAHDEKAIADAKQRLIAAGVGPKAVGKMQPGQQTVLLYSHLPQEVQVSMVKEMTPQNFKQYVMGASPIRGAARMRLINEWGRLGRSIPNE